MLKTIIIEDEPAAAHLLEEMLKDIEPKVEVMEKCSNLPQGVKSIKRHSPDIVFLDIELPVYSGLQLLEFFNPEEITFQIIFTTAYNEYAMKAFEMSAVDYLLKPLQEEKLNAAIQRVYMKQAPTSVELLPALKENLQPNNYKKIVVPVASGFDIINLADICYFKAEGSYTNIFFCDTASLLVSKNLKHFEFILSGITHFVRIHRSYIANLNYARKIIRKEGGILLLENKSELPVAEDKMDSIIDLLHRL
ncbi:MAG TPA: LytTR family DNA-binding domain-containing protein [Segetibacter sp.]|nr:LytTR family DNA-binding domain-containing protein [Segetibacter sp.]